MYDRVNRVRSNMRFEIAGHRWCIGGGELELDFALVAEAGVADSEASFLRVGLGISLLRYQFATAR